MLPPSASFKLERVEGAIKNAVLTFHLPIDRTPWNENADAGSRTWLVAQAMDDTGNGVSNTYSYMANESTRLRQDAGDDNFHVRNYDEADRSKRLSALDSDDEELPEDKFHRKDAMSSYILQQRKDEAKEKQQRHEE